MYATMDSAGIPSLIYFIGIVLLESYFVVNLFLAVLKNKFAKASVLASKVSITLPVIKWDQLACCASIPARLLGALARVHVGGNRWFLMRENRAAQ